MTANGYRVFVGPDGNVLESVVIAAQPYKYS